MSKVRANCAEDDRFCRDFAQLVADRGLNLSALSRRTGVSRHVLYRIIDGQPPTLGQALLLATEVGLPIQGATAPELTAAEAELVEAVRAAPPDIGAIVAALRALGIQLPTVERNPSSELSPTGLRKVGKAASGLAAAIAEVVGDESG